MSVAPAAAAEARPNGAMGAGPAPEMRRPGGGAAAGGARRDDVPVVRPARICCAYESGAPEAPAPPPPALLPEMERLLPGRTGCAEGLGVGRGEEGHIMITLHTTIHPRARPHLVQALDEVVRVALRLGDLQPEVHTVGRLTLDRARPHRPAPRLCAAPLDRRRCEDQPTRAPAAAGRRARRGRHWHSHVCCCSCGPGVRCCLLLLALPTTTLLLLLLLLCCSAALRARCSCSSRGS